MASLGLKMILDTGAAWPDRVERAPREGTVCEDLLSFCLLLDAALEEGRRSAGAAGLSLAEVENSDIVVSEEADRRRLDGAWTAMSSTGQRWE